MKISQRCTRRQFLGSAFAGAGLLLGSARPARALSLIQENTFALDIRTLKFSLNEDHKTLDGLRIGVLSDIHHGACADIQLSRLALNAMKDAKIDLLLLAGDFIWVPDSWLSKCFPIYRSPDIAKLPQEKQGPAALAEFRSLLDEYHFPLGTLCVFGNHDHWSAPRASMQYLNARGIRLLRNETQELHFRGTPLQIFGADDFWTGRPKLEALQGTAKDKIFRILLAHNPDYASFVQETAGDRFQLAICGHTHGGQIKLPGVGALIHNIEDTRFLEGLSFQGNFPIFTSRGLGTVEIPYRVNCPPEATIFQFVS